MAQGEFLCFVNSDAYPITPDWAVKMLTLFKNPKVGLVGPKLLFPDGRIQSCGGWYDAGNGPFHRFIGYKADYSRAQTSEMVSWITGAVLMISKELFEAQGGYDEGYKRGYFEDVHLCEQIKAQGREVWYCAEAIFTHEVGQSTKVTGDDDTIRAQISFNRNATRFHKAWDSKIKPDVYGRMVPY